MATFDRLRAILHSRRVTITPDKDGYMIRWGKDPLSFLWQSDEQAKDPMAILDRVRGLQRDEGFKL